MRNTYRYRMLNYLSLAALIVVSLLLTSFASADFQSDPDRSRTEGAWFPTHPGAAELNMLRSDETGVLFELQTPLLRVEKNGALGIDGLQTTVVEPGLPALPYFSTFIAVPPEATVSVTVKENRIFNQSAVTVPPAPRWRLSGSELNDSDRLLPDANTIGERAPIFENDQSIYGRDAIFPQANYEISEPMYQRDLRIVELKLYPLHYNPVRTTVTQATKMMVQITFSNPDFDHLRPAPGSAKQQEQSWNDEILNFDQARTWRSLPQGLVEKKDIALPTDTNSYKIEVDQDGIYELLGSNLAARGMSLPVDPSTIQMMHGGQAVAYQFVDMNNDQMFDAGDKIRFYGWAFDGSRQEKLYVSHNVFWLWAGGQFSSVPLVANEAGAGTLVSTFRDSITAWQENYFFSGWAINWDTSPNDATNWHSDRIDLAVSPAPPAEPTGSKGSKTFNVDLPYPAPVSSASYLVELTTILSPFIAQAPTYTAKTTMNDATIFGESAWFGHQNVNVVQNVPGSTLKQPTDAGYPSNQIKVDMTSTSVTGAAAYMTRITVDYTRMLVALGDQLIFGREVSGPSTFQVSGFANSDPDAIMVWDISDRYRPQQIVMQAQHIQDSGSDFTYLIGRTHGPQAQFIATISGNIMQVRAISQYKPGPLDPPSGKAQWLAITHSSLRSAADDLAQYRETHDDPALSVWVVDTEDITNQIGYGINSPATIRSYLVHALSTWTESPGYVTIFGDATINPRNLDCVPCTYWDKDAPTLVVTDFAFVDRYAGMVPSDFSMSLLVGNDLIPDVAIGRLPANTLTEANYMVQKIIRYENQRRGKLADWQRNFVFVADDKDDNGDFCYENRLTASGVPSAYTQNHLCLPKSTPEDTEALRVEMGKQVNDHGASILNYRGHGSDQNWAGTSGSPPILTAGNTDFWQNVSRSLVILSADCLDGYFVHSHSSALGESFMRLNDRGSVAHWSSSGLGFTYEHRILHSAFYDGVFRKHLNSMGDAVNFAKNEYHQSGGDDSELYSFILLGDPAMKLLPFEDVLLPVMMSP